MLPSQLYSSLLLGQRRVDPLTFAIEVSEPNHAPQLGVVLAISLAVVAAAVGVIFVFKKVVPQTIDDGKLLFAEMCRANHLTRRQRKLLQDMAHTHKVRCPSQMLVDVSLWAPDADQPAQALDTKAQAELLRLRSLLFTQGKSLGAKELDVRA
jgi:hypothetical protein